MHKESGRIVMLGVAKNVGRKKDFWKREVWIDTEDEGSKYPNVIKFEAHNDKCQIFDGFKLGDTVTVGFFVEGRKWKSPKTNEEMCFVTLKAFTVEAGAVTSEGQGDTFAEAEADGQDEEPPF